MNNNVHILILSSELKILGYLRTRDSDVSGEPLDADTSEAFAAELQKASSPLQIPIVGTSETGERQYGFADISINHPKAPQALAETLRRDGIEAYPVSEELTPAWILVNNLPTREDRRNALSYLLYVPVDEVGDVVKNLADLKGLISQRDI